MFVFSPDVILCGWLGSEHQLTNELIIIIIKRKGTPSITCICSEAQKRQLSVRTRFAQKTFTWCVYLGCLTVNAQSRTKVTSERDTSFQEGHPGSPFVISPCCTSPLSHYAFFRFALGKELIGPLSDSVIFHFFSLSLSLFPAVGSCGRRN